MTKTNLNQNQTAAETKDQKLDFGAFNKVKAQVYNNILPAFLCAHCGLVLESKGIWDRFKSEQCKSLNLSLFESLWHFPEEKMLKLYTEDFKSLRYCCKMVILDACLNTKRILQMELERQNTKLVEASKVLTNVNQVFQEAEELVLEPDQKDSTDETTALENE